MSTADYVFSLSDGTTTVAFTSAPWALLEYVPQHPQVRLSKSAPDGYAGETPAGAQFANVVETLSLLYTGTSGSAVSAVQSVERLLRLGERNGIAIAPATVYLQAKNSATDDVYRSPVYSGRVDWDPRTLGERWRNDQFVLDLTLERAPWWEAATEALISTTVGGDRVYATDGGSAKNAIVRTLTAGDVAAPVRMQARNITSGSVAMGEITVVHRVSDGGGMNWGFFYPVSSAGRLLASAGSAGVTVTPVAYAYGELGASGSALQCDWASTGDVALVRGEDDYGGYVVISDQGGGAPTLFTAKLAQACGYTDLYLWLVVSYLATGQVLDQTPPVLAPAGAEFVRLGALNVPPMLMDFGVGQAGLAYTVHARRNNAANTLKIASLQMAAVDEQRVYTPLANSGGVVYNGYLLDDPDLGVYTLNASGSAAQANYTANGPRLTAVPGVSNAYTFYLADTSGSSQSGYIPGDGYNMRVELAYRPRRVTL